MVRNAVRAGTSSFGAGADAPDPIRKLGSPDVGDCQIAGGIVAVVSVQDLYVLRPAAAMSFGPALRFVERAWYATPRLTRHIGGRSKREAGTFAAPPHAATPELVNGHAGSGLHAFTSACASIKP